MADLSTDVLTTPATPKQVKAQLYETISDLGVSTTNWKAGGVVRLVIAMVAILASSLSGLIASLARSAFLATAVGDWLTLVARYVFGCERFPATFATAYVQLVNSLGGEFPRAAGEVIIAGPSGKTYTNADAFTLDPLGTVLVPFVAQEAGVASNAGVGVVTTLSTPLNGVTVANTTAFIARDRETDDALRARAALKPRAASPNGPSAAYEYFALTATREDGSLIGVNRVAVSRSSATNQVTVWVAAASGSIAGSYLDPSTDLGAVHASLVSNALSGTAVLATRTAVNRPVDVAFWAYFDRLTLGAAPQRAIVAPVVTAWLSDSSMPIGGVTIPGVVTRVVPRDTLRDVVSQAFVDAGYPRPRLVRIFTPTTDVSLAEDDVPVPGNITAIQP